VGQAGSNGWRGVCRLAAGWRPLHRPAYRL